MGRVQIGVNNKEKKMNNKIKTTLAFACAFAVGLGFNSVAMSAGTMKVAVVNVQQVVEKSAQVNALKKEQETKLKDLQNWLTVVKNDVEKQQTQAGKEKLIAKYDAEFAKKQQAIRDNYATKLSAIDTSISATIATEAKTLGYDLVLAKSIVLFGGSDITEAVAKKVK